MSNLMLFEEENLLHHVDRCYGKDYLIPNEKDNSTECLVNIPLISPQSTLNEKPLKLVSESSLPTEHLNLLSFLQENSTESLFNPFISTPKIGESIQPNKKQLSTNPFLEDLDKCQDHVNNLSPEMMFMEIWERNRTLQTQIITVFNILMAKLDSTSKKPYNYLPGNETTETYEQRLLYASEVLESIILKEDISFLLESKSAKFYSTNVKTDATPNKSNEIFIPSFVHGTDYTTAKPSEINDNSIGKALLEYLKQIDEMNDITLNSTSQVPNTKSSFLEQNISTFTHLLFTNDIKTETSAFQYQNGFIDNRKDHFYPKWSQGSNGIKDNGSSETNPFKLLLKLKDCNSTNANQAENIIADFEKYCSLNNTNFNENHFEVNSIGNDTLTVQHDYTSSANRSVLNPFSPEFVPPIQKNPLHPFQNTTNVTLQSEMISQSITKDQYHAKEKHNVPYENSDRSLNSDYNYFNTYLMTSKSDNVEQSSSKQFSSIDESVICNEELSWFDRSNNLSNSQGPSNISAEAWIRGAKNTLSETQYQNENDVNIQALADISSPQILNKSQQFKANVDSSYYYKDFDSELTHSLNKECGNNDTHHINCHNENNLDFQSYNGNFQTNISTNDIGYKGQIIKNDHDTISVNMTNRIDNEEINIPYYEFLISTATELTKLFFQTVDINNRTFCIFHFEDEGWLLLNEFVEVFTPYVTISEYYKQLQIRHINIKCKEISRLESPTLFFQLDKMQLNVSRDSSNKVNNIHLMSLKSIITVLVKLQIVTRTEVDNVITKRDITQYPILHKAWVLIRTYGKLRCLIQEKLMSQKI
ncbi:hypothetical protein KPH14_006994 [Odynerus spinipes]|uniref:Uncharacterized protein n=1 Tax=Odynerus spinipes TaxID=1348599 RepID=A0AAD9RRL1_9HYME|nr:hypothetical protein KPH14_006994 [Odynerus spinipes]